LKCDKCNYVCAKAHRLKNHIDVVHLGIKRHQCHLCSSTFATTGALNKHILSHTYAELKMDDKSSVSLEQKGSSAKFETHMETFDGADESNDFQNCMNITPKIELKEETLPYRNMDLDNSSNIRPEYTQLKDGCHVVKVFNCSVCKYSTNDKSNFKRHQQFKHNIPVVRDSRSFDEVGKSEVLEDIDSITCQLCNFKTAEKNLMIKHIESIHSEVSLDISKTKSCKFCHFTTDCRKKLKQHKKREHKHLLKVFPCNEPNCSFMSHWEESIKLHRKFHVEMKDYPGVKCDYCDFIYKYHPSDQRGLRKCKQTLNEHMNDEHADQKLKCDLCDKCVWTEQQLRVHKTRHENSREDGTFSCDKCNYVCAKAHRLKFHIDAVHLGIKKHLCDWCPSAFATTSALNKHILSHTNERNFQCPFCEKAFHSKGNLNTHIRTHTGEKPFTCDICGKSFSDQAYFAKHKRLHEVGPNTGKPVKDFICPICNKGFTRKSYLNNHVVSHDMNHTDGKAAKYTNEFKMEAILHAKIHGINKTAVDLCINRSSLKNWVKLSVHPHTCNICGKAFSYKAQLKKHEAIHPQEDGIAPPKATNTNAGIRYDSSLKEEVVKYALETTIQDASVKYSLAHSTINNWVKRVANPRICHLCSKSFPNESMLRRHLEQVHKNTPDGALELMKRLDESQSSQSFSEFLADHHLLPSEEEVRELTLEKEKQNEEKLRFAMLAQQALLSKQVSDFQGMLEPKREVPDEINMNLLTPLTFLTESSDHQNTNDEQEIKSEY